MNSVPVIPRRLQLAVIASVIIAGLNFLSFFAPILGISGFLFLVGGFIAFAAGICGTVCGASILFSARGFHRWVAVLSALVSLYAVVRCAGLYRFAMSLP